MSAEKDAGLTFKIVTPHNETRSDYHGWFFPNGWRGVGPIEQRDRAGRRRGRRTGYLPDWFVLMCNNPDCDGLAVVPVRVLTDYADAHDTRPIPPAMCHNGHLFEPGVTVDDAPGESHPDWCNVCGEARVIPPAEGSAR